MTNAEKFQEIFKKFATEVWAFPEKDFLTWLNAEYEEPRKGHWINTANPCMSDNIVCSECGYNSIADYKFCPNCGSRNEVEE